MKLKMCKLKQFSQQKHSINEIAQYANSSYKKVNVEKVNSIIV